MEFTVTGIDYEVETTIPAASPYKGKDFNGQGAILVGNASSGNDSKTFLGKLKVGDKVNVKTEIKLNAMSVSDKHLNAVGYHDGGLILQNGTPANTWNEAHPRTAIGYSQDGKKFYMIVRTLEQFFCGCHNRTSGCHPESAGSIYRRKSRWRRFFLHGG